MLLVNITIHSNFARIEKSRKGRRLISPVSFLLDLRQREQLRAELEAGALCGFRIDFEANLVVLDHKIDDSSRQRRLVTDGKDALGAKPGKQLFAPLL